MNTIKHFKAGESGYYDGRQRGTVAVWHDSQLWLYPQSQYPRKGMRAFIQSAWENNGRCTAKVSGAYPDYHVKTEV